MDRFRLLAAWAPKFGGAANSECTHVAIPRKNSSSVYDQVVLQGYAPLVKVQIFSMDHFDDALALARLDKSQQTQKALSEFALIQSVYESNLAIFLRPFAIQIWSRKSSESLSWHPTISRRKSSSHTLKTGLRKRFQYTGLSRFSIRMLFRSSM